MQWLWLLWQWTCCLQTKSIGLDRTKGDFRVEVDDSLRPSPPEKCYGAAEHESVFPMTIYVCLCVEKGGQCSLVPAFPPCISFSSSKEFPALRAAPHICSATYRKPLLIHGVTEAIFIAAVHVYVSARGRKCSMYYCNTPTPTLSTFIDGSSLPPSSSSSPFVGLGRRAPCRSKHMFQRRRKPFGGNASR